MPTISKIQIGDTSYDLKDANAAPATHTHIVSDITSGILSVANGGTGQSSHTVNAVLTGNGTSAVNNVETANGALYATTVNGAAQFGILPIALGGTDATTAADAVRNIVNGRNIEPQRISAASHISTDSGNIYTSGGNIYTSDGSISAYNGNIYTTNGNILTDGGDVIITDTTGTDLHKLSEKANTGHTHSANNITSGTLPITRGGTGQGGIQSSTDLSKIIAVPENSGVTVNFVLFYKWGAVAQIAMGITFTSAKSDGNPIAYLKSVAQPITTTLWANFNNSSPYCLAYPDQGVIRIKGNVSASTSASVTIYIGGTYILKDPSVTL